MKPDLMHEGPERTPEYPRGLYVAVALLFALLLVGMVIAVNHATSVRLHG